MATITITRNAEGQVVQIVEATGSTVVTTTIVNEVEE